MNAAKLMTTNVLAVNIDARCDQAARLMYEHDVGSVPVIDDTHRVIGIVTDRDLCLAAYTKNQRFTDIAVQAVMSKNVICANETDTVEQVEQLMQAHQIRRIPVIDKDGHLSGIIAIADLARANDDDGELAATVEAVSHSPG